MRVTDLSDNVVKVKYLDYGNVEPVPYNSLWEISVNWAWKLPAQAVNCTTLRDCQISFDSVVKDHKFQVTVTDKLSDGYLVKVVDVPVASTTDSSRQACNACPQLRNTAPQRFD